MNRQNSANNMTVVGKIHMNAIGLSTHPGIGVDGASGRGESSQISF